MPDCSLRKTSLPRAKGGGKGDLVNLPWGSLDTNHIYLFQENLNWTTNTGFHWFVTCKRHIFWGYWYPKGKCIPFTKGKCLLHKTLSPHRRWIQFLSSAGYFSSMLSKELFYLGNWELCEQRVSYTTYVINKGKCGISTKQFT